MSKVTWDSVARLAKQHGWSVTRTGCGAERRLSGTDSRGEAFSFFTEDPADMLGTIKWETTPTLSTDESIALANQGYTLAPLHEQAESCWHDARAEHLFRRTIGFGPFYWLVLDADSARQTHFQIRAALLGGLLSNPAA